MESQVSQVKGFSSFLSWDDARVWLTEIIPFIYISAAWGQCPAIIFHILSSLLTIGSGGSLKAAR